MKVVNLPEIFQFLAALENFFNLFSLYIFSLQTKNEFKKSPEVQSSSHSIKVSSKELKKNKHFKKWKTASR
jgi:hypothetical protein